MKIKLPDNFNPWLKEPNELAKKLLAQREQRLVRNKKEEEE